MKSIAAEKLRGRSGAVLLATGALLGAIVVGAGGSIAATMFNQTTADKRYVKSGSVLAAGRTIETKLPLVAGATFTPVATTSIKAPVPGLVQVTASISADDDVAVGHGKVQYQVKVGNTVLNPTETGAFLLDPIEGTPPTNTTRANGEITGVVKIPAAATVPITLLAREAGAGSILQGRSISAVFVPAGKFPKVKTTKKKKPTSNVGP
jgi:hypothetical protein